MRKPINWELAIERFEIAHSSKWRKNTRLALVSHLNQLRLYCDNRSIALHAFSEDDLEDFMANRMNMGRKLTTRYNEGYAIKRFFQWLAQKDFTGPYQFGNYAFPTIAEDEYPEVPRPTEEQIEILLRAIMDYWDPESSDYPETAVLPENMEEADPSELPVPRKKPNLKFRGHAFCERMATRDLCIIALLVASGQRIGEILALRHKDLLDVDGKLVINITRSKSKKVRGIPVDESALGWIAEWQSKLQRRSDGKPVSEFLFSTNKGEEIQVKNFDEAFTKYREFAGLDRFTCHGLRHYVIAEFSKANAIMAQFLAGHSSFRTTNRYIKLSGAYLMDTMEDVQPLGRIVASMHAKQKEEPLAAGGGV